MDVLDTYAGPFRVMCRGAWLKANPGAEDDEWVDDLVLEPGDIVLECKGLEYLVKANDRNALADAIRRPE